MKDKIHLFFIAILLIFPSCYHEPPVAPHRVEILQREVNTAQKALKMNDTERAIQSYMNALKIARSIQDEKNEAIILINLSRLYTKKGNLDEAVVVLDSMERLLKFSSIDQRTLNELREEYQFEVASINFLKGLHDDALLILDNLIKDTSRDSLKGRAMNLKARILIHRKNRLEAEKVLEEALRLNRDGGSRLEEANTLRLLGDINLMDNARKAIDYYKDALRIDKSLAIPEKIGMDLEKIAEGYERLNDREMALIHLIKAYDVWIEVSEESAMKVQKKIKEYKEIQ